MLDWMHRPLDRDELEARGLLEKRDSPREIGVAAFADHVESRQ